MHFFKDNLAVSSQESRAVNGSLKGTCGSTSFEFASVTIGCKSIEYSSRVVMKESNNRYESIILIVDIVAWI